MTPGANKGVSVNLNLTGGSGAVQLFIGQGYVPTPQQYDIEQVQWNSPSASAVIPTTSSQTYYVTAYAQSLTSAPAPFTLAASTLQFSLSSVQPGTAVNSGSATLTFVGAGFASGATYQLVSSGGTVYNASAVFVADAAHADVTFAMSGLPTGTYTARVTENGSTVSLANALTVTAPGSSGASTAGASIQVTLNTPEAFRSGFPAQITLNYQNISGADLPAPLINLTAAGATLAHVLPQCTGCNANFSQQYQNTFNSGLVLGINREGPAGVLPAGAQGSVSFLATPTAAGNVTFTTQNIDETIPDPLIGYTVHYVAGEVKPGTSARAETSGVPPGFDSIGSYADAAALCDSFQPPWANAGGFSRTCMQLLNGAGYSWGACGPY